MHASISAFYWLCLLLGGGIVVLQFGASLLGLDHDAPHDVPGHGALSEGLQLFSLRALSAGVAFFGVGGLAGQLAGLPTLLTVATGAGLGVLAAAGMATLLRGMHRLERDNTFRLSATVGHSGTVYLGVPGGRAGAGKIHIEVQGRLMELDAITPDDELPTGTRVLVTDTIAPTTVIVTRQPRILEDGDGID